MERPTVDLEVLTWVGLSHRLVEAGPGSASTLVVPLGATEQHGPHLPLHTDTVIATAWARAVAEQIGATVAPALAYGASGEHQGFPGTLSIGHKALQTVIVELCRSARHDFESVVLLSGHAGNIEGLRDAEHQLVSEGHRVVAMVPSWADNGERSIDAHAGRTETSIMLHLRPDLVDRTALGPPLGSAPADPEGRTESLSSIMDQLRTGGVAAVSSSGILGRVAGATAQEGGVLFNELVSAAVRRLPIEPNPNPQ